jgi:hypothetical protein
MRYPRQELEAMENLKGNVKSSEAAKRKREPVSVELSRMISAIGTLSDDICHISA